MNTTLKNTQQKGYAILFTVVIISIISLIAVGMSNTNYKQLLLSSVAKDSQVAFYKSDTATECALYADNVEGIDPSSYSGSWECGVDAEWNNYSMDIQPFTNGDIGYDMRPSLDGSDEACFDFTIKRDQTLTSTSIYARGYSTCNKENFRAVEREIQVTY